jgi:hypothetical protein
MYLYRLQINWEIKKSSSGHQFCVYRLALSLDRENAVPSVRMTATRPPRANYTVQLKDRRFESLSVQGLHFVTQQSWWVGPCSAQGVALLSLRN